MRRASDIGLGGNLLSSAKYLKLKERPRELWTQYVRLFKVLWKIEHNAAMLELLTVIKVYLVFSIALSKEYKG